MKGNWKGYYTYDKKSLQSRIGSSGTYFELTITDFDGKQFTGKVEDEEESGGTPGIGTVVGTKRNNEISFIKKMPVKVVMDQGGDKYILRGKHPDIYYHGIFNGNDKIIEGTWRIKFGIVCLAGFPVPMLPTKGKFRMEMAD